MNIINNIKYSSLSLAMLAATVLTSCDENIEIGKAVDESPT